MKPLSILFGVLVIARVTIAQSGYNYPSPFNPLAPGANDLGNVPNVVLAQPSSTYSGSQPGFNNQFGAAAGIPTAVGPNPTLQSGYTPSFVQPTPSSRPSSVGHSGSHSSGSGFVTPSGFPASSDAGTGFSSVAVGSPGLAAGFPNAASSSSSFPHSSGGFGHHSGSHATGGNFPGSGSSTGGFQGQSVDSGNAAFGGQTGGNIGGFGGQANNFGGSNDFNSNDEGDGDYSAIPGTPGVDYPIYTEIPKTSFDCRNQPLPGYYADIEAQCQVFHICALNTTFNFLCPNGTIFSQEHLVCVWWNQFDCNSAPSLFVNNANIYDYSKNGQQNQGSSQGFAGQDGGFNNNINIPGSYNANDGSQQNIPFGSSQPTGTGFGSSQSTGAGFGSSQSTGAGFGSSQPTGASFGSSQPTGAGFGQQLPSHSQSHSGHSPSSQGHLGSGHSQGSHSGPHSPSGTFGPAIASGNTFGSPIQPLSTGSGFIPNIPSSQIPSGPSGFPSSSSSSSVGSENYPIAPEFGQSPAIPQNNPSSPTPFGVSQIPSVTGYPAAGTPTPQLPIAEQPSREYLPQRRTL